MFYISTSQKMDIWVVFYFLTIMNNAAENFDVQAFLWTHVFYSLGYTQRSGIDGLYDNKKNLNDTDNHDDNTMIKKILMTQITTITHLEPDTLECEVKWALGSITTNKASGGDGIPAELFQILNDDAVQVLHSICQQIWKTQQWPQDWKRSVFIPVSKKGNAKNVQSTTLIALISHTSKVMLKILQARLQQYLNWELPGVQAGFRKGRGTRDQIANTCWIIEKAKEFQKNIYFCFIDYAKAFDCGSQQILKSSSRDRNTRPSYLPPEKPVCRSRSNS